MILRLEQKAVVILIEDFKKCITGDDCFFYTQGHAHGDHSAYLQR